MHTLKLTPKPQSDYRLEVDEIQETCKLEKHGYRHNKVVYGFCESLPDMDELESRGMNVEEIPFDEAQVNLTTFLVERSRAKSKLEHLERERKNGTNNEQEESATQKKLVHLNNNIQTVKDDLGITGVLKVLKF